MTRRLFNKAVSVFLGLLFIGKLPAAPIKIKPVSDLLFRIRRQHYWEYSGPVCWLPESTGWVKKSNRQVWHVCIKCPACGSELVTKYTNVAGLLRGNRDLITSDVRHIMATTSGHFCNHCREEFQAVTRLEKEPNIDFDDWAKFVETTCRPGAINS